WREWLVEDAEIGPDDPPTANQLFGDDLDRVAWNGEAEPFGGDPQAGMTHDRGIDPDHFSPKVEQGPTGVAGVDRGVVLDHVLHVVALGRLEAPSESADDPGRHRVGEVAEGAADGDDLLA